mgnify:CR=1 FL=1
MEISPEQNEVKNLYPARNKALAALVAGIAALVSCERHVPGIVPSQLPGDVPATDSTPTSVTDNPPNEPSGEDSPDRFMPRLPGVINIPDDDVEQPTSIPPTSS